MALGKTQRYADATARCTNCGEPLSVHYVGTHTGATTHLCPTKPGTFQAAPYIPKAHATCIKCLATAPLDAYLRNDHICDGCASKQEEYPFASTSGIQLAP